MNSRTRDQAAAELLAALLCPCSLDKNKRDHNKHEHDEDGRDSHVIGFMLSDVVSAS